jgi:hypothetical protein
MSAAVPPRDACARNLDASLREMAMESVDAYLTFVSSV